MITKKEIWKPVKGYEGLYEASSLGRIKSLPRNTTRGKIRVSNNIRGYPSLRLSNKGVITRHPVHRLVLKAFLPNPENKPQCNHKNGIKHDNRIENLEWSTAKENARHAFDTGLRTGAGKKPVCQLSKERRFLRVFESLTEGARYCGCRISTISSAISGTYHTAGGFRWCFAEDLMDNAVFN